MKRLIILLIIILCLSSTIITKDTVDNVESDITEIMQSTEYQYDYGNAQ